MPMQIAKIGCPPISSGVKVIEISKPFILSNMPLKNRTSPSL